MHKPQNFPKAIVIGGSAGSIPVVRLILSKMPSNIKVPIFICLHRMKNLPGEMCEVLSYKSTVKTVEPCDKEPIIKGIAYVAPANYHLLVEDDNIISLSTEELVNYSRPSIDVTLSSCAKLYNDALIGILLTGANKDGAIGLKTIKEYGGITIVQDPKECTVPTMPLAALELNCVDFIMNQNQIAAYLKKLLI